MQASLVFVATIGMMTTGIIPALGGEKGASHSAVKLHELSSSNGQNGQSVRAKRLVYPEQIREAIHGFVLREISGRAVDCQVSLGEPQQPIVVPSGTVDLQISGARSDEPLGRRVFQVHLVVNGQFIRTVDATADIAGVQEVVVPVRPIKMDEQIDVSDVATERIVLVDLKHPYVTNSADVVGKAAIRPLPAQSAIRTNAVRRPFAVHKGDRVTIEARQGNLSIQTVGVTKSHGEMGQTITVSNVDSGKELRATVVAPGVVRVSF
jgi:flagella basal body P-ring formation protein FlgA